MVFVAMVASIAMTGCLSPPGAPESELGADPLPLVSTATPPACRLRVERITHRGQQRWSAETDGLVMSLIETGLSDFPWILPELDGAATPPGWETPLFEHAANWRLEIEIDDETEDSIEIYAKICPEPGNCSGAHARGPRTAPSAAVAKILARIAEVLHQPIPEAMVETWSQPLSEDPYALLLLGRAAAQLYGYMPPTPPRLIGDKRNDPSERAIYVDPTMALGYWIRARRQLKSDEPKKALASINRAIEERGHRAYLRIVAAAAWERLEEWKQAGSAWEAVSAHPGYDLRFAVRQGESWAQAGAPNAALELIDSLPANLRGHADIARLRVNASERAGIVEGYEERLEAWARAAPADPEPLRRLIAQGLRNDRKSEVRLRLQELEARGAKAEAQTMAIAMDNELRRYHSAYEEANKLQLTELARQIRARKRLERDGNIHPLALAKTRTPGTVVVAARALLAESPERSLNLVSRLLRQDPWFPEALAVQVRAYRLLENHRAADESLERLVRADPALNVEHLVHATVEPAATKN